jgi:hypothetical protein
MYGGGRDPFMRALSQPALRVEFQNRLREIRDLLFNHPETDRLIDECARIISRPGALSIVDADRFKWDYHPMMGSSGRTINGGMGPVGGGKAGQGRFYQAAQTHDFAGMVANMKAYVDQRAEYIDRALLGNSPVPKTPSIAYAGPKGFPVDELTFKTGETLDPGIAALEWRVGQIDKGLLTEKPKRPGHYEITALWETGEDTELRKQITIPSGKLKPGDTYRVRCRVKDSNGRWSHWSEPIEFVGASSANH